MMLFSSKMTKNGDNVLFVRMILPHRDYLFAKFSVKVTHEGKRSRWLYIRDQLVASGLTQFADKDDAYMRQKWSDMKRRTLEKLSRMSQNPKGFVFNEVDCLILKAIGERGPLNSATNTASAAPLANGQPNNGQMQNGSSPTANQKHNNNNPAEKSTPDFHATEYKPPLLNNEIPNLTNSQLLTPTNLAASNFASALSKHGNPSGIESISNVDQNGLKDTTEPSPQLQHSTDQNLVQFFALTTEKGKTLLRKDGFEYVFDKLCKGNHGEYWRCVKKDPYCPGRIIVQSQWHCQDGQKRYRLGTFVNETHNHLAAEQPTVRESQKIQRICTQVEQPSTTHFITDVARRQIRTENNGPSSKYYRHYVASNSIQTRRKRKFPTPDYTVNHATVTESPLDNNHSTVNQLQRKMVDSDNDDGDDNDGEPNLDDQLKRAKISYYQSQADLNHTLNSEAILRCRLLELQLDQKHKNANLDHNDPDE